MKRISVFCLCIAITLSSFICGSCTGLPQKDDPNSLGDYPPQFLGKAHLNIVKRFSDTLLPRDVSFVFDPQINVVKFHHKLIGDNIWIYLTKENRAVFRKAIEQYLAAFAAKTLTPEGAKKKGSFGKIDVFMTWGIVGTAYEAFPTLRFDYQFITPQRPYLILANATVQSKDGANCPAIRIAISPAQCKDLLPLLEEAALLQLVSELQAAYDTFDIGNRPDDTV